MKFVVEHADFCPRVIYIPDNDVPQDVLDKLSSMADKDGMIVMEYTQLSADEWRQKETEANEMAHMLLLVHENLTCWPDGGFDVPEWTRNATTVNHKSFNTKKLAQDCTFYFVEDLHLDEHKSYIEPVYDNVNDLLKSYPKNNKKDKKKEQQVPDLSKDFPPLKRA